MGGPWPGSGWASCNTSSPGLLQISTVVATQVQTSLTLGRRGPCDGDYSAGSSGGGDGAGPGSPKWEQAVGSQRWQRAFWELFLFLGLVCFNFLVVLPWDFLKPSRKFQLPQLCVSELGWRGHAWGPVAVVRPRSSERDHAVGATAAFSFHEGPSLFPFQALSLQQGRPEHDWDCFFLFFLAKASGGEFPFSVCFDSVVFLKRGRKTIITFSVL